MYVFLPIAACFTVKWIRHASHSESTLDPKSPMVLDWILVVSLITGLGEYLLLSSNIQSETSSIMVSVVNHAFSTLSLLVAARLLVFAYRRLVRQVKKPSDKDPTFL